jgi:hypothetical protein
LAGNAAIAAPCEASVLPDESIPPATDFIAGKNFDVQGESVRARIGSTAERI